MLSEEHIKTISLILGVAGLIGTGIVLYSRYKGAKVWAKTITIYYY